MLKTVPRLGYFTATVKALSAEGYQIDRTMLATLSPYLTCNLKR